MSEPRVYLIAETQLVSPDRENAYDWLTQEHDSKQLPGDDLRSDPEWLIEAAGRRCYRSFAPGLNPNVAKIREDPKAYFENILSSGHGSVLEHSSATFALEGVSRVFTHEIVRNRAGAAYSQESQRYVRLDEAPTMWLESKHLTTYMLRLMRTTEETIKQSYALLCKEIPEGASFEVKKALTSLFRRIVPQGVATGIVCTWNFRALRWLIEQRTSAAAEEEMRLVVGKIAEIAVERWPLVFGDFVKGEDGTWTPKYYKV